MSTSADHPFLLGLILAGGESRRMGRDKALLPVSGFKTLLHRQVALMQQLPLDALVVSRHSQLHTPDDLGVPVISDQNDEQHDGPLAGIHSTAFAWPDADYLLVMPVDLPLMDSPTLKYLLDYGLSSASPSYFRDEYLPLLLPLNDDVRQYLRDQLSQFTSDKSIRGLLRQFNANSLSPKNVRALTNTNTVDEWHSSQQPSTGA